MCCDTLGNDNKKRVPSSYIDQLVVNPINFGIFEKEVRDMNNIGDVRTSLLRLERYEGIVVKIYIAGRRVLIIKSWLISIYYI